MRAYLFPPDASLTIDDVPFAISRNTDLYKAHLGSHKIVVKKWRFNITEESRRALKKVGLIVVTDIRVSYLTSEIRAKPGSVGNLHDASKRRELYLPGPN